MVYEAKRPHNRRMRHRLINIMYDSIDATIASFGAKYYVRACDFNSSLCASERGLPARN